MKTQRKFCLCAALLAAATLFLACTNGTQSVPSPQSNALTIKFDSTVACKKGILGNEGDVTTGAEVKEGDWYKFTALGLTGDEIIENWYINGNKQSLETNKTFTYNVKKSDADTDKVINVTYTKKTAEKLTLKFKSAEVACKKGFLGNEGDVTTDAEVKEGNWYKFTALGLTADEIIENWYVNGNKKSTDKDFTYQVKKSDADSSNVINITYTKKTAKLTVTFNTAEVICKKGSLGNEGDVTTGAEVKEGDWYRFTALGLSADEKVENWYINGNKQSLETYKTFIYNVKKSDAGSSNVINVTYKKKTAMKATLTFDSAGIKCEKGYSGNEGDVTTGAEVKEGEGYKFTALLNPGETVKHWIVNGNPKTYATETTFSYIVMATDISSDNKLSVSFVKN